jgi:hypothetical protein
MKPDRVRAAIPATRRKGSRLCSIKATLNGPIRIIRKMTRRPAIMANSDTMLLPGEVCKFNQWGGIGI